MTREPFIAHSELTNEIYIVTNKEKYRVTEQAIKAVKAIKALEQEPILDKIRAEIEEQIIPRSSYTDKQKKQVIEIIDKYRGYSPCDDCEHEGSFGKEFDDTCMQCKSGSNRTESR